MLRALIVMLVASTGVFFLAVRRPAAAGALPNSVPTEAVRAPCAQPTISITRPAPGEAKFWIVPCSDCSSVRCTILFRHSNDTGATWTSWLPAREVHYVEMEGSVGNWAYVEAKCVPSTSGCQESAVAQESIEF